jgi:energy-coupling factor transporter ATP-binding protein EcfA2
MKLKRIEARSFLSFGEEGLVLDELGSRTVIVGPNSSGKTNIFRIIDFVLQVFSGKQPDPDLVRHDGRGPEPSVQLTVVLDDEEAAAFSAWMVIKGKSNQLNPQPGESLDLNEARRLTDLLLDELKPAFKTIGSGVVDFVVKGSGNPVSPYDAFIRIRAPGGAPDLFVPIDRDMSRNLNTRFGGFPVELHRAILEDLRERFPRFVATGTEFSPISPQEFQSVAETLRPEWFFEKMKDRGTMPSLMDVRWLDLHGYETQLAGRPSDAADLRRFLTRRGWSPDSPAGLVQFFVLVVRSSIGGLEDLRLAEAEPELPDPKNLGVGHTILGGSGLAAGLYNLKNSSNRGERATYIEIQRAFASATAGLTIEAVLETYVSTQGSHDTAPSDWIPLQRLSSGVRLGQGDQRWLSIPAIRFGTSVFEFSSAAAASGLRQLLAILCLACSARDSVLFLDEPEMNLHPAKQREILRTLLSEASARSNQVIVVTHSPNLVDPRQIPDMVRLAPRENGSVVFRPAPMADATAQEMARRFERTPKILAALFATKVVLVEGGSEEAALPIWIDKLLGTGSLAGRNIEFIDVGGDGGFEQLAEILRSWGVPFRAVCDAKSGPAVEVFNADGYAYPKEDFSKILEDECGPAAGAANAEIKSRNKAKAVAVAREVALRTDPPPTVRLIYDFLRPFLEGLD